MPHPLLPFLYCPVCGARAFAVHDARSRRCMSCGFTLYANASASTVAVIVDAAGRLLCVRREREPARGTLDLPGGFVDPGETLEAGCLREVREETGLDVRIERYLFSLTNVYPFSGLDVHTTDSFFLCRPTDPLSAATVRAADDAADARWIAPDNLEPALFGLRSIRCGVERLLADRRWLE
ncbi:MAG: NUDIX domain-containing protein [Bacteroidales bacterium]|nr:NUDIX domain-containing protein [Bacteroidales bacterium]